MAAPSVGGEWARRQFPWQPVTSLNGSFGVSVGSCKDAKVVLKRGHAVAEERNTQRRMVRAEVCMWEYVHLVESARSSACAQVLIRLRAASWARQEITWPFWNVGHQVTQNCGLIHPHNCARCHGNILPRSCTDLLTSSSAIIPRRCMLAVKFWRIGNDDEVTDNPVY